MLIVAEAGMRKPAIKRKKRKNISRVIDVAGVVKVVKKIKPKYCDVGLLLAVTILSVFGILMVYSASKYNAVIYYDDPWYFATKQIIGLFIGIMGLTVVYFIDYRACKKYAYIIFTTAVILLACVFITGIGVSKLGASRWVGVAGFSIQPSEIAKFAFVIFAAKVLSGGRYVSHILRPATPTLRQVMIVLFAGGILCVLIILEPNMSITMCIGIIMFLMLFLCGGKIKTLAWIIIPGIFIVVGMLVAEPYRLKRLSAFIDPWATPKDEGFQLIQSLYSIGNGGFFGVGFGQSVQKYMFLPFSESDFIFSIFAEEFGLLGSLILFAVFAYMIYKIIKIGCACPDFFGRYLCFGIAAVIFTQSALNFAVATGCIPPTGLPLPFISFGGTSLLVFLSAIGVVLNIDKQNKNN